MGNFIRSRNVNNAIRPLANRLLQPSGGEISASHERCHCDGNAIDFFQLRRGIGNIGNLLRVFRENDVTGRRGIPGHELPAPRRGLAIGGFFGGGNLDEADHPVSERECAESHGSEVSLHFSGDLGVPEILTHRAIANFSGGTENEAADIQPWKIIHHPGSTNAHRGFVIRSIAVVGDIHPAEVEIDPVVAQRGIGDETHIPVSRKGSLVPLSRQLLPDQIMLTEESGPIDFLFDQLGCGIGNNRRSKQQTGGEIKEHPTQSLGPPVPRKTDGRLPDRGSPFPERSHRE